LHASGWLAVEIGIDMAGEVSGLFTAAGFEDIRALPDLQGIERVVIGRSP
jgi:methylase of polypeptide subunit release factors